MLVYQRVSSSIINGHSSGHLWFDIGQSPRNLDQLSKDADPENMDFNDPKKEHAGRSANQALISIQLFNVVSPCFTMFHHVSPCFTMFHHVSPCFTMFTVTSTSKVHQTSWFAAMWLHWWWSAPHTCRHTEAASPLAQGSSPDDWCTHLLHAGYSCLYLGHCWAKAMLLNLCIIPYIHGASIEHVGSVAPQLYRNYSIDRSPCASSCKYTSDEAGDCHWHHQAISSSCDYRGYGRWQDLDEVHYEVL